MHSNCILDSVANHLVLCRKCSWDSLTNKNTCDSKKKNISEKLIAGSASIPSNTLYTDTKAKANLLND